MMKQGPALGVIVLSVLALPGLASAGSTWKERKSGGGVAIYSRDKAGSGVATIKGIIRLPYSSDQVAKVMTDLPNQKYFVPHMKSIRVLKQEKLTGGRIKQLLHQVNALPVLKDRDVVIAAETWSKPQRAGKVWRSIFKAVTNAGPAADADTVRIRRMNGSWKIAPAREGKGSVVTYVSHTEVGGSVPDFVAELGQVGAIFDLLKNLRVRCWKVYGKR